MFEERMQNLGTLRSVHGLSPAFLQRTIVVGSLSFVFFLGTLAGFYVRQTIGYFLLSTIFLIVYVLTMFRWLRHKRNVLTVYENGFTFKNQTVLWDEIETLSGKMEGRLIGGDKINFTVRKMNGEKIVLTEAIHDVESVLEIISEKLGENEK